MGIFESPLLFLILSLCTLFLVCLILYLLVQLPAARPVRLVRHHKNPILSPNPEQWWESEAVFNPAAIVHDGMVHLFYRALGGDGVSRIGHATSADGIHFDRSGTPAYDPSAESLKRATTARTSGLSYATLSYDTVSWGSGGGWGGSEDPRAVIIDDEVALTFTSFEGWSNVRMMLATLPLEHLAGGFFNWDKGIYLSAPGQVHKNWVLFPEKVRGRYAVLHNIYPEIEIAYIDPKNTTNEGYINSRFRRNKREGAWDTWVRGAGAPPLKTSEGWLLLYHAVDERDPHRYKVGAMLLDLKNPKKVLYRSTEPILEPDAWYENDWKPGVVYATGAVIVGPDLIVYYGGGDKHVAAARANLQTFLYNITHARHAVLEPVTL